MRRGYDNGNLLPIGFREVNSIIATGTQYIVLNGLKVNDWDEIECEIFLDKDIGAKDYNQYNLIGATTATTADAKNAKSVDIRNYYGSVANPKKCMLWYGTNYITGASYVMPLNNWIKIKAIIKNGCQQMFHDDIKFIDTNFSVQLNNNYDCYLFGINCGNNFIVSKEALIRGKMKDIEIRKDGNTIYHLKKCIRLSDGIAGYYDLCGSICNITNSPFYISSGIDGFLYE